MQVIYININTNFTHENKYSPHLHDSSSHNTANKHMKPKNNLYKKNKKLGLFLFFSQ